MRLLKSLLVVAVTAAHPGAQTLPEAPPAYSERGIVPNGGSQPAPLAPGMLVTLYGERLGPEMACTGSPDPHLRETPHRLCPNQTLVKTQVFPQRLCDTEVRVGGLTAGLLYVHAGQINFKVPQSRNSLSQRAGLPSGARVRNVVVVEPGRTGRPTVEGAQIEKASAERARNRALELYEELLRSAPDSPEARAGQLVLPRLKLRLGTGERTFFCFSC